MKKQFVVLSSVDASRPYRPSNRTVLDFATVNELFGSPDRAQQVKTLLGEKVQAACHFWNELYSDSDREVSYCLKIHFFSFKKSGTLFLERINFLIDFLQ